MPDYKTMYFELVGEVADAIDDLRALETSAARISMGLRRAMQRAENTYVNTAEAPDEIPEETPAGLNGAQDETQATQNKAPVT